MPDPTLETGVSENTMEKTGPKIRILLLVFFVAFVGFGVRDVFRVSELPRVREWGPNNSSDEVLAVILGSPDGTAKIEKVLSTLSPRGEVLIVCPPKPFIGVLAAQVIASVCWPRPTILAYLGESGKIDPNDIQGRKVAGMFCLSTKPSNQPGALRIMDKLWFVPLSQ